MNPSDYRRDFAEYNSAVEREHADSHAGLTSRPNLEPVEERYADLWTRETIGDLLRAREETPEQFATQRAGLAALAGAARLKNVEAAAREVTGELRQCLDASRVEWGGEKVSAEDVPGLLAVESDAQRRSELALRWFDSVRACDDLRAARLETLDAAVRALGLEGAREMYESFAGVDVLKLSSDAGAFLERTESVYMANLARWKAEHVPQGARGALLYADLFFFRRAAHRDAHFDSRGFRALHDETLAGLGIRPGSPKGLRVDDARRQSKGAATACFPVRPPEDVRLVVGAGGPGLEFYRQGFREAARAQLFAWASPDLAARHPEFVHAPDRATEQGHALLFDALFRETAWLSGIRGMRETEADAVARDAALVELYDVRRECALLRHALTHGATAGARSEQSDEEYASLLSGATGFKHDAATRLLDAGEGFRSATSLRARLFAAGMREHLRTRGGRRWFASRAAGGELIDVWNTVSRHSPEELARLLWGGELSFDLLADALAEALGGDV